MNEEAEMAESQIEWFEKNKIDLKKKNRYAKVNLVESVNYDQRFAEKL